MKKIIFLVVSICVLSLVSGCAKENTLVCKMSSSESGIDMNQTATVKFKDDDVTTIISEVEATLSEELVNYKELFISTLKTVFDEYEGLSGVSVKTEDISNDKVKITMTVDISKMDAKSKEEFDLVDTSASYSNVKKTFEDEGYTCK